MLFGIKLQQLYLIVSDACNINCSFCYKKNLKKEFKELMTEKVALDSIEFALNLNIVDNFSIHLWGGEPLMNKPVIRTLLETYPQLFFTSNSNGELINSEEDYKWLLSHKYHYRVVLSIGSCKERYGSFENAFNSDKLKWTMKFLLDGGQGVNFVVDNPQDLYKDFKYIYDFGIKGVLLDIPTNCKWTEEQFQEYEDQYLRILSEFESLPSSTHSNLKNNNLWLEYIKAPITNPLSARFCHTGLKRIVIDPKGDVWQCDNFYIRQKNPLGSIYSGIDYSKLDYLKEFVENTINIKRGCEGCEIYRYCPRNKCLGLNWELTGDILKPDWSWCRANKAWINITKKYIKLLEEKSNANRIENK